jgi:hypothetical protein
MEQAMTGPNELYYNSFSIYAQSMDERNLPKNSYIVPKDVQNIFIYATTACPTLSKLAGSVYQKAGEEILANPDLKGRKISDLDDGVRISEYYIIRGDSDKLLKAQEHAQNIIYAITDPTKLDIDFQSHTPQEVAAYIRKSAAELGGKASKDLEKDLKLVEDNITSNYEVLKTEQLAYRKTILNEYGRVLDTSTRNSQYFEHDGLTAEAEETIKLVQEKSPLLSQLVAEPYRSALLSEDVGYFHQVHGLTPSSGYTYVPSAKDDAAGMIMHTALGEFYSVEAPKEKQTNLEGTVYEELNPKRFGDEIQKAVKLLGGNPESPALKQEIEKVRAQYQTNWEEREKNNKQEQKSELDELRQKLGGRGVKVSDASDLNSGANLVFAGFQKQQVLEV